MASLEIEDLTKRNNFALFKTRISSREPFLLAEGNGKTVRIDPKVARSLKTISDIEQYRVGQSIIFPTTMKGQVRLRQLYKDARFAGRSQNVFAAERAAISDVRRKLEEIKSKIGSDFVNLRIGKEYYRVSQVVKSPGRTKGDFNFIDDEGKSVGFVSHKDGTTPRSIQQWGGISLSVESEIASHPETQAFVSTIQQMYPNGIPNATTVARTINDTKLKMQSIYGNQYGGESGPQNVDLILQGIVSIQRVSTGKYKLTASTKSSNNGQMIGGEYEPVFMAIYKGDRNDYGVEDARMVISPKGGRGIKQYV